MTIAAVEDRAREIIATSRVKMGPEIVAVAAIGKDGTQAEYRAALAVALAAGDWQPKPLYDLPRWRPVPGGAMRREGNLIHLRLGADIVPATDLLPDPTDAVNEALSAVRAGLSDLSTAALHAGRPDLVRDATEAVAKVSRAAAGVAEVAPPKADPAPVDLWQRYSAPDLPRDLLPPVIERFAREQGELMGADPAGLAMSALAVCAAAIPDAIELQVKRHDPTWREAPRLWVGLVGLPSVRKSPIISAALRPLRRLDKILVDRYLGEKEGWKALPKEVQKSTPEPPQHRHIVEDATIEALQEVLKDSHTGILSAQDELSGWFGAMDKYSPGKGAAADRAFWLRAFNGGAYSVNRVSRGVSLLPNLSINLLGGIQPEPLLKIANDSVDDGLIQRFIPVVLQKAAVGRDCPTTGAVGIYDDLIERLTQMRPDASRGIISAPSPVRFDDGAIAVRERLEREHVELVGALESVSPKLASHFGKFDGLFARLCLIWHCIETEGTAPPPMVAAGTAERVARFMEEFVRPSAVAFYAGLLGMTAGHEELVGLAAYIVSEGLSEIGAREVQRSTRALRQFNADEARRVCERLESFGWLVPVDPRQRSSSPRWRVVPAVHSLFAERGRAETERRAAAREALQNALGNDGAA